MCRAKYVIPKMVLRTPNAMTNFFSLTYPRTVVVVVVLHAIHMIVKRFPVIFCYSATRDNIVQLKRQHKNFILRKMLTNAFFNCIVYSIQKKNWLLKECMFSLLIEEDTKCLFVNALVCTICAPVILESNMFESISISMNVAWQKYLLRFGKWRFENRINDYRKFSQTTRTYRYHISESLSLSHTLTDKRYGGSK